MNLKLALPHHLTAVIPVLPHTTILVFTKRLLYYDDGNTKKVICVSFTQIEFRAKRMRSFEFAKWDSIDAEMKRFALINQTDPEKGKIMYSAGETLVSLASNGSMSKLHRFLDETDPDIILIYFVYKALKASLMNGHLMISAYIVDCGYPINNDGLPNIIKECLTDLEDYLCVSIVRMFASKGLEICKQVKILKRLASTLYVTH